MLKSFRSSDRFDALDVSDATKRALSDVFKYERLSAQQARYIPLMLRTDAPDVFVKAGTGSGKTLGFLLPAVESLTVVTPASVRARAVKKAVRVLVLSPTRELAAQTAAEAEKLLTFHVGRTAGVVTGGTDRNRDLRTMRTSPPDILVATPGRLQDLLEAEPGLMGSVRLVVLDEADRLLDPGFAPAVRKILATLPSAHRSTRRTLLLTATVPPEVQGVARQFMREGFEYIDASGSDAAAAAGPANPGVEQAAVMSAPGDVHVELASTLQSHRAALGGSAKVLVFFSSIALAELYAAIFRAHPDPSWAGLLELHGGLAQNKRTRAMDEFRTRPGGVLFASDAAGRGIDIPNVTLVVQVGAAPADVYQQRVGRTGRAGAKGQAVILLGRDEVRSLGPIKGVAPSIVVRESPPVPADVRRAYAIGDRDRAIAERAFRGALGAYKALSKSLGWKPQDVVDAVAARVLGMGLTRVPEVNDKTLGKMGLKGVSFDTAAILSRIAASSGSRPPLAVTRSKK